MSFEEKYDVSQRKQKVGTYTAKEIIKLLRKRELSTIHKVKVDDEMMTVATFIHTHEAGGLPEQNFGKEEPGEKKKPSRAGDPSSKSRSASSKKGHSSQVRSKGSGRPSVKGKMGRGGALPKRAQKRRVGSGVKGIHPKAEESGKFMSKPLRSASMVGLFLILAYLGCSWINGFKVKGQIENLFEQLNAGSSKFQVIEINLDGFFLINDPRYAKVQVLYNGEPRPYYFKFPGYRINGKVELVKKKSPAGD